MRLDESPAGIRSLLLPLVLLVSPVLHPAAANGQDAEFALWLQQSRDRLVTEGWPVDGLAVPTTDAECQRLFNEYRIEEKRYWDTFHDARSAIETDAKIGSKERTSRYAALRTKYVAEAKRLGRKYQFPIGIYTKERANFEIYRQGGDKSEFITLAKGTPPSSEKHGGSLSDIDAEGGTRVVENHEKRIRRITKNAKISLGPTYITEEIVDMTVFKRMDPTLLGFEARLTAYRDAANSKEIDLSAWMKKGQACRNLAELQTHVKKGAYGLTADPQKLLADPMKLEAAAKVTVKALKTAPLSDAALAACLRTGGLDLTPGDFRKLVYELKYEHKGMTPGETGVLGPETAEAFQRSIREVFVSCQREAEASAIHELSKLKQDILVAERSGDAAKAKRLRSSYLESIAIAVEAANANHRRLGGVRGIGDLYLGMRYRLEPLVENEKFRREARDFLLEMKAGRISRKVALLVLNFLAKKSPHAVLDALEAARRLDSKGTLDADPEFRALLDALESTRGLPRDGTDLTKHAAFLGAARKFKAGVVRLNEMVFTDLRRTRSMIEVKGLDTWFGVQEALSYWSAFKDRGMAGVATEIVRFRVPLVHNVVNEDYLRAAWEMVCIMYPPAGQLTLAYAFGTQIATLGVQYFWDHSLESLLDEIYQGAEFRLVKAASDDAGPARFEFVRATFRDRELTRKDFLAEENTWAFGSFEAEVDLRMTVAAADPVLATYDRMEKDLGPKAVGRFVATYEARWDLVKRWWAGQAVSRLEARMQAEDALTKGTLLDSMFELDRILRSLDAEDWVRSRMAVSEFSASEKAYIFWVNVRSWITDGEEHLFSSADPATRAVVVRLAAKELAYLTAYREVAVIRREVETAIGAQGRRELDVRLLSGFFFLGGSPTEDVRTARRWRRWLPSRAAELERKLLAIKRTFLPRAELDTEFDRDTYRRLLGHAAWARGWREAELSLQRYYVPAQEQAASHFWAPFDRGAAWLGEFYAFVNETRTEAIATAELFLESGRAENARKDHERAIHELIAAYRAHYAGDALGRVRILVRRLDGDTRTSRPITGVDVTWVMEDERAVESAPGVYEFGGLPPGYHRFLATATGFSSADGEPAAAAMLSVPAEATGAPPSTVLYLRADEIALRGTVRDDLGEPVIFARVKLVRAATGSSAEVRPDPDGRFGFVPVEPGRYRVQATADGFLPIPPVDLTVELPTRAGAGPAPVEFTLTPILTEFVVTVVDGSGVPVEGATLRIADEVATTDATGAATLPEVRPGPAVPLSVTGTGFVPHREKAAILPATAPSRIERRIVLSGGVGLAVAVRNLDGEAPVSGAEVTVSAETELARGKTASNGVATFRGLAPGFVYLDVAGVGFATRNNVEVDLSRLETGGQASIEILVEFGMRLTVRVRDGKGELVPGAYVSIDGGPDRFAPTGVAVIEPVRAGSHRIRAKARGMTEAEVVYEADPTAKLEDTVSLALRPGLSLTVEVRDPTGALLRGPTTRIRLVKNDEPGPSGPGPVHTFAGLAPGRYSAIATAGYWGVATSRAVDLSVAPKAEVVTVTLGVVGSIQAVVSAGGDATLPAETTVRLEGGGIDISGAGTGVRFGGLVSGRYVLTASAPGFAERSVVVRFAPEKPGDVATVSLALSAIEEAPPEVTGEPRGRLIFQLRLQGPTHLTSDGKTEVITPKPGSTDTNQGRTRAGFQCWTPWDGVQPLWNGREFSAETSKDEKTGSAAEGGITKTTMHWRLSGRLSEDGSTVESLVVEASFDSVSRNWISGLDEDRNQILLPSCRYEDGRRESFEFKDLPIRAGKQPGTLECEIKGEALRACLTRASREEYHRVKPLMESLSHYREDKAWRWQGPQWREGLDNGLVLKLSGVR